MLSTSSNHQRLGVLVATLIVAMSSPSRAGYSIRDLGVIAPSGTSCASALNSAGEAAGMATTPGNATVAVQSSGNSQFAMVSVPSGATSSQATGINLSGDISGDYVDASGDKRGFYTSSGSAVAIAPLDGSGGSLSANGINASGAVIGTGTLDGYSRAFEILGGSTSVIATLPGGYYNVGNGINAGGTIVGASQTTAAIPGSQTTGARVDAFIDTPGANPTDLLNRNAAGAFAGNSTYGMAIANDYDVVGYGEIGGTSHAFYASSQGGSLVQLDRNTGAMASAANGVNDFGQVVGELGVDASVQFQASSLTGATAFLWSASTGSLVNLNTLLSPVDRSQWFLADATGINDSGQISGMGYLDGQLHGFILTPAVGTPEPPTWLLSAIGIGSALAWSRSRLRPGRTGVRAGA